MKGGSHVTRANPADLDSGSAGVQFDGIIEHARKEHSMQKTTWDDFRQQCMLIDPYLSVEYSTEIYDAWMSGDTPEGAVSQARKIYHEFEE